MYEVYALKYGERDTTACQFFYRESSHEPITLHYFVWLILGGPHPILVDTGFLDDDARARGIRNYVSPAAVVERAGVKPGDVPIALITTCTTTTGPGTACSPPRSTGSSGTKWPSGRDPSAAARPSGSR